MSQQEFEQNDQEVLDLVNDHAHPEAEASAEEIKKDLGYCGAVGHEPTPEEKLLAEEHRRWQEEAAREMKRVKSRKRREVFGVSVRVAICVAVACVLVAAMFAPELLIWIVNAGVLCCGIVAAIMIDRWRRTWR